MALLSSYSCSFRGGDSSWNMQTVEKILHGGEVKQMLWRLNTATEEALSYYRGNNGAVASCVDYVKILPGDRVYEPKSNAAAAFGIKLYGMSGDFGNVRTMLCSRSKGSKKKYSAVFHVYKLDAFPVLGDDDNDGENKVIYFYYFFLNKNGRLGIVLADQAEEDTTYRYIGQETITCDLGHYCAWCGDDSRSIRKKYCGVCFTAKYCSKTCQLAHFRNGHAGCKVVAAGGGGC